MILSISRRTDIPAFYMDWFLNRQNEGYLLTRNPMNRKQVSKVNFSDVSCYVFWTKDPRNLVKYFDKINKPFMAQITITPYLNDIEKSVNQKQKIINSVVELSERIGSERLIWRYDPILFNDRYTVEFHLKYFEELCKRLDGCISTCVISFLEIYKKIGHIRSRFYEPNNVEKDSFVESLLEIANKYNITLKSCGSYEGIEKNSCIDVSILKQMGITGYRKDKYQRDQCNCIESVDVGSYNTCPHHCMYCYANYNHDKAYDFYKSFDQESVILGAQIVGDEIIKDKVIKLSYQISMFE